MPLAGIWTIEVASIYGWENRGILIFCEDKNHVMGGGRTHYSIGSYSRSGNNIKVELEVHYHSEQKVIFGDKQKNVSVVFQGKHKGGKIRGEIKNPKDSKYSIPLRLTKRANLP